MCLADLVKRLVVYPENMKANLARYSGLVHSQRVLLALTQAGVSREDAYRAVQRNAMAAWDGGGDFFAGLRADPEVRRHLDEKSLLALGDLGYHTKHVDMIFRRVFGEA